MGCVRWSEANLPVIHLLGRRVGVGQAIVPDDEPRNEEDDEPEESPEKYCKSFSGLTIIDLAQPGNKTRTDECDERAFMLLQTLDPA